MLTKCNVPITFGKNKWPSKNIIRQFMAALRSYTSFNVINLQIVKVLYAEAYTYHTLIHTKPHLSTLYVSTIITCSKQNPSNC